jgi:hypothetical protein
VPSQAVVSDLYPAQALRRRAGLLFAGINAGVFLAGRGGSTGSKRSAAKAGGVG